MNKKHWIIIYSFVLFLLWILFFVFLSKQAHSTPFFSDHARGWFWYEDPGLELTEEPKNEETEPVSGLNPILKPKTARERLAAVQEHLLELKAKAILEPTQRHVKAYQEMQMKVIHQSEAFSKAWMMNVYMNPTLDENVKNPSAQAARFVVYEEEHKETERII